MPLFDENERLCTAAQQGDLEAREALVLRNLPFCAEVARRYLASAKRYFHCDATGRAKEKTSGNLDDLTQSAVVGLLEAIDGWDLERGSFLTYAEMHMTKAIRSLLGIRSTKRTIDHDPDGLGISRLDAPMTDEGEDSLASLLPDPNAVNPERYTVRAEVVSTMRRCFSMLSKEDREILAMKHLRKLEAKQIAEAYGQDPSWVQYRLGQAERRLRKMDEVRSLMDTAADPRRSGTQSFRTTHTSSVEAAVLNRERQKKP